MQHSSMIQAQIEPTLKMQGEQVLQSIGLSTTAAITILFTQLVHKRSFPLALKVPNAETLASFEEAKNPDNLTSYTNVKDAFDDLWVSE